MKTAAGGPAQSSRRVSSLIGLVMFVLVSIIILVFFCLEKSVSIIIDGESRTVNTFATTVGELLADEDIQVDLLDEMNVEPESRLLQNQEIKITRAFNVAIHADGKTVTIRTTPLKVKEALAMAGIELGEEDIVSPALNTLVEQSGSIQVSRITTAYETAQVAMAYATERREDSSLEKGISKTIRAGKNGVVENVTKVTYKDGEAVNREVVSSNVIKKPQNAIIAYGIISLASRGGRSFTFTEAKEVKATAYTATGNRTATGTVPEVGTVAVDPKVIPLGSQLYIEGYGYGKAEDTGGSIKGNKIDIYLESEAACIKWGVKKVKIYLLEN